MNTYHWDAKRVGKLALTLGISGSWGPAAAGSGGRGGGGGDASRSSVRGVMSVESEEGR